MTKENQAAVLKLAAEKIKKIGMQSDILEDGNILTLRMLAAMTDDAHPAFIDVNLLSLEGESEAIQYYSTLTFELTSAAREELLKAIPSLNFYSLIGAFGIYNQQQLYYKYGIVLPSVDDTEFYANDIMNNLIFVYSSIDRVYPLLRDLMDEKITFQKAVQTGAIKPI